jgi:hypothetical protein
LLRDLGEDPADLRDAALLAVGVASGCRRSELSGLDWMQRGAGEGVIEITEEGATITLFSSKTSQGEEVETIHIQPGVALKALRRWIAGGGIAEGSPMFRAVSKSGGIGAGRLSDGSIRNGYTIKIINKERTTRHFRLALHGLAEDVLAKRVFDVDFFERDVLELIILRGDRLHRRLSRRGIHGRELLQIHCWSLCRTALEFFLPVISAGGPATPTRRRRSRGSGMGRLARR